MKSAIGIAAFLAFSLLLTALAPSLPDSPSRTLSTILSLLPLAILLFATLRFGFVFPAAAVEEPYGLRNAWAHTRGQTLRLFAAFLVTALPLYLLMFILTGALLAELPGSVDAQAPEDPAVLIERIESDWLVSALVGLPFGFCFIAIVVGAFSAAFRITTGWYPPDPAAGAAAPQELPKD